MNYSTGVFLSTRNDPLLGACHANVCGLWDAFMKMAAIWEEGSLSSRSTSGCVAQSVGLDLWKHTVYWSGADVPVRHAGPMKHSNAEKDLSALESFLLHRRVSVA